MTLRFCHVESRIRQVVVPMVEPDKMGNDLGRKAVALIADFLCLHRHRLLPDQQTSNIRPVNVTTPCSEQLQTQSGG